MKTQAVITCWGKVLLNQRPKGTCRRISCFQKGVVLDYESGFQSWLMSHGLYFAYRTFFVAYQTCFFAYWMFFVAYWTFFAVTLLSHDKNNGYIFVKPKQHGNFVLLISTLF